MSKKLILFWVGVAFAGSVYAQTPRIDSLAVFILDRAAVGLQNLTACSFTASITYDVMTTDLGLVKHSYIDKIVMRFPDKMQAKTTGDKGRRIMVYDGEKFWSYSYDRNNYAEARAPESIIAAIHTLHADYGIEFPAADFFYPTFTDDIIATGGNLIYLGTTQVDGKECHHIAGLDPKGTGFQFWIADESFLPAKMILVYGSEKGSPQYEATYTDWVLNPVLSDTMFEFVPPPAAVKTKLAKAAQTK